MINSLGDIFDHCDVNHQIYLNKSKIVYKTRLSYRDAVLLICTIVGMRQKVVQITTPVNVLKRLVFLKKDKVLQCQVNSRAVLFGAIFFKKNCLGLKKKDIVIVIWRLSK
jgi:hypothetical protein